MLQVIKAGGEWQMASETSLEERENSMTVKSDEEAGLELGQFKFPLCMTTSLTWYTVEPARLAPSLSWARDKAI